MGFKTLPSKLSDAVLTVANVAALSDVTDPQEGDERYVADIDVLYMYTGAAWAPSASSSGAPLAPSRGGTGISNNDAATLTRSGNHAVTITTTGTTNSTLPAGTKTLVASGDIVNADIAAGAAITRTKLANGTADHVVINGGGTGVMTSEAALNEVRGGTGVSNPAGATLTRVGAHALTLNTSGTTNLTLPPGTQTLLYSGGVVDADINGSAAIAGAKIAAATATTFGVTKTYAPAAASSVHTVSSANYDILDADGYDVIAVTTGGSARTVTLPTLAANLGRKIVIKKLDATGTVIIEGENAETVDGAANQTLYSQYSSMTVVAETSGWLITDVRRGVIPWTTLSFSSTPAGWSLTYGKGMATEDSTGVWTCHVVIQAVATTFTLITFTIDGCTPAANAALATDPNSGAVVGASFINTSASVRYIKTSTGTSVNIAGTFVCASKPTW